MSQRTDMPDQENMSELLEELRRTYETDSSLDTATEAFAPAADMTEEELKEKLRLQFMSDGAQQVNDEQEESYYIDEDFLAEAELEQLELQEPEASESIEAPDEPELNIEYASENDDITFDELEETEEDDGIVLTQLEIEQDEDDDITFDELEETEEDDGIVLTQLEIEQDEDDDITFDELEETEEDDGIVLTQLEIEQDEDDDITFDELEETEEDDGIILARLEIEQDEENNNIIFEQPEEAFDIQPEEIKAADEGISYMHLDQELLEAEAVEELVAEAEEYCEPQLPAEDEWTGPKVPVTLFPEQTFEEYAPQTEDIAEDESEEEESSTDEADSTQELINELESSEISLLMQFGCEDEVLDRYSKESINKASEEEALRGVAVESDEQQSNVGEKILSRYEAYGRSRGALILKLAISAFFALLLLIYEGSAAIGVDLPGIMNREDYYISHVLLGLQAVVLCGLVVYRQIWDGAKKVFSRKPNAYSVISVLAIITLIYDVSVFFVEDTTPPTFHFALVCVILLAVLLDYQTLVSEKRSFEFYFSDVLFEKDEGVAQKKKFTLCRSEGKRSTAEKMYSGGLDASQIVYFPIETDSSAGFFSASKVASRKHNIPSIIMIPVMAVSLLIGILAMVISGEVWQGFGASAVSLFMAMPIVWTVAIWLPFERLSAGSQNEGFAFAGEGCVEHYADCDMVIFSDLHLFAKCAPSNVNMVFYDATPRDVLLGCLNAVYSEIGGPLSETFKGAYNEKLGVCRMTRVAKSGIEAVVGSNYSVLVGNEAFMLRYGINFPKITMKNQDDEIFTLCVSINGRASARIAVRYTTNEMFEMFVHRLAEDGIYCAIETLDPMISTEMVSRVRNNSDIPLSIVHLGVQDCVARKDIGREKLLFNASGEELGVLARGSRFNLAVALSASKHLKRVRKYSDMLCVGLSCLGALITLAAAILGWVAGFSEFFIILYWLLSAGGLIALILKLLPPKNRFSVEQYRNELNADKEINETEQR